MYAFFLGGGGEKVRKIRSQAGAEPSLIENSERYSGVPLSSLELQGTR